VNCPNPRRFGVLVKSFGGVSARCRCWDSSLPVVAQNDNPKKLWCTRVAHICGAAGGANVGWLRVYATVFSNFSLGASVADLG